MTKSPGMTPGDANDIFLGQLGQGRRKREVFTWKRGVYKRLASCYGLDKELLDTFSDSEPDPEKTFRDAVADAGEIWRIVAVKTEVTLEQLLNKPLDNPAFEALCRIDFTDPFGEGGGVVFPVPRHGDWILHTLGHPPGTLGGRSYIITYAKRTEDLDIMAESLDQFIQTRKQGVCP